MSHIIKKLLSLFCIAMLLSGCIFVAGAAAGAAAIAMVYDHRPVHETAEDAEIQNRILNRLRNFPELRKESHIDVTVFNRIVLLTGQTPNPEWREQVEAIAAAVPHVVKVYNQLTIEGPTSSLTRASDAWITAKIKTQMLATEELKTNNSSIKVVTENGVVYLMGNVTHNQADIAVDIARHVAGVQRVIKIFQYKPTATNN
jgi:osmotically-inducible protein OsmY